MPLHFKKAIIASIAFSVLFNFNTQAQSNNHRTETWSINYAIDRVEYSGGYTMLSGNFNKVGPYSGSGVEITSASDLNEAFPKINGCVLASVPDGNGGWFIGGSFDLIDNVAVKHLAHIKSDNTLDANFKPTVSGLVYAMAISGSTLYIGGTFQSINSTTRNFLAAINASNGSLTAWNPNCNQVVHAIALNGSTVYVGGNFTSVAGQTRNKIVAVDANSGTPTSWDPSVTGTSVLSIAVNSSSVFIGGQFTQIGGTARASLGAVDVNTGSLLSWDPNPFNAGEAIIETLLLSANTLYVGGKFSSIDSQSTGYLASVDATTGSVNSWDPQVNNVVYTLALSGGTLYAGGQFFDVNGTFRQCIAAISASDASLLSFSAEIGGTVNTISISDDKIFIGGDFSGVNWIDRNDFALFNDATDELWPFDIALSTLGNINTIAVKDNVLYFGGHFTTVNGQARLNVAAINLTDGQLLSWNPSVTDPSSASNISEVFTMKIKDNLLYVGGRFMEVDGQTRESLAAIDLMNGAVSSWHPVVGNGSTPDEVYSIDISGNRLYVGGEFTQVATQSRSNLAAIDITNGNLLSWDPQSNDKVWKIRVSATTAYVVGNFDDIDGTTLNYNVAAIDLSTAEVNNWFPDFQGGFIMDVALTASDLIVAGYFSMVGTEDQNGLASFSQSTGALNNWKPDVGQTEGGPNINALDVSSDRIHVGGAFENVGDEYRSNYAEYSFNTCAASPTITLNGSSLISTAADSFQWYLNDQLIEGATNQTLDILLYEYGVYTVEANIGSCIGRSADFVYLITGNEHKGNDLQIFPNPVVSELSIQLSENALVTIFDITGKEIHSAELSGQVNKIDAQHFTAGIYVVKIKSKSNTSYYKIHKKF
jgi:hypothetical protein